MTTEQQEEHYIKLLRMFQQRWDSLGECTHILYCRWLPSPPESAEYIYKQKLGPTTDFCCYCSYKKSVLPGLSWLELLLLCSFSAIGWRGKNDCPRNRQFSIVFRDVGDE